MHYSLTLGRFILGRDKMEFAVIIIIKKKEKKYSGVKFVYINTQ